MSLRVEISYPAAVFLRGVVKHLNQKKILPDGSAEALQTSAWLEEIEARLAAALDESHA